MMPENAIEYFKSERNKQTEPYRKFYDEAIAALRERADKKEGVNTYGNTETRTDMDKG